jgi:hypothetical protein
MAKPDLQRGGDMGDMDFGVRHEEKVCVDERVVYRVAPLNG